MDKTAEGVQKIIELISGSFTALTTVFILSGIAFLFLGFLKIDGSKIISRDVISYPPVLLGAILSIGGLVVFARVYSSKTKTVVFYTPTIKANFFFMELLDYSVELAKEKGYNFIIEKGNLERFHRATNYLDVIRKYSGQKASNTVLIMIPPSPDAYRDIWGLPKDFKANLITLDMEIGDLRNEFFACPFHKRVILVDNQSGAEQAAAEIKNFCKTKHLKAINIIICEGKIHSRGRLFKAEMENMARESKLEVCFLGQFQELSFSFAVVQAGSYVKSVVRSSIEDLKKRETFIFCANDNMAIGARMEVSHLSSTYEESFKPIHIICFDASALVKTHVDQHDEFFWLAIDQQYTEIVRRAFESAEQIFSGQKLENEVIQIKPTIHMQY